jgi:hypothetical protein
VLNAKIVVGGRVTGILWVADTGVDTDPYTHKHIWVRVWNKFCIASIYELANHIPVSYLPDCHL